MSILTTALVAAIALSALPADASALETPPEEIVTTVAADELIVEGNLGLATLMTSTSRYVWCPMSHPWVKQTVTAPDPARAATGWVNVFEGLNGKPHDSRIRFVDTQLANRDGMWGIFTTVAKDLATPALSADLNMHCTSDSNYNPYRMKITGTPPQMHYGQPYDYQLTLTGPEGAHTKVNTSAVTGLPGGLTIDETGKITGTPTTRPGTSYTVAIPLTNDYVQHRPVNQFTMTAGAINPNITTYTEIVFDRPIGVFGNEPWTATCPDGYYLDNRISTPDRVVGQGILVEEESFGITVVEREQRRVLENGFVRGVGGDARNLIGVGHQNLTITMVCTNELPHAWTL